MTHRYHTRICRTCKQAIDYIASQQQPNGAFSTQTTFYTSLILCALEKYRDNESAKIKENGVNFLLEQKSNNWSFNYYHRGLSSPYPDDLDDTFAALKAISLYKPNILTPEVWVSITNTLTTHGNAVGGPYRTWITDDPEWDDIDIIVNVNILSFLSSCEIALPTLEDWLDSKILNGEFSSRYYHDPLIVLCLFAKGYRGKYREQLKSMLLAHCNTKGYWQSDLITALAISALLHLGQGPVTLIPAIEFLLDSYIENGWQQNDEFYIESKQSGNVIYSFCNAYTAACCIEALTIYDQALSKDARAKDPTHDVLSLSTLFFKHILPIYKNTDISSQLTNATRFGSSGYTIIDKIMDGEQLIDKLPLAIHHIRAAQAIFCSYTDNPMVQNILNGIERAVAWEHDTCKMIYREKYHEIPTILPDYGEYHRLAEKSLGLALGPIILCLISAREDQAQKVESFFRSYLIARQLNDDAHDWLLDLRNGFLNSVSVDMIREIGFSRFNLEAEREALENLFWNNHLDIVSNKIIAACQTARTILKEITIVDQTDFLNDLLLPLEHSAETAISERNKTREFLAAL